MLGRVDEQQEIRGPHEDETIDGVGRFVSELPLNQFSGELDLSDQLRTQLNLEQGDSLRLLHADARTLLLERVRETSGIAVPWDRDLVLSADVQSLPMADVLSLLHRLNKSGFLLFASAEHEKSIYLHRGEVVFASSNQDVDRLGECLFRGGMLTLAQLRDAEERWTPNSRLGKVLVERGTLTPRELWDGVKYQVEEIVRSLFAYTTGSVHFWEGEVQPDNVVRLSLPTRRLVSQGLRRRDELLRFLAAIEDSKVVLEVTSEGDENLVGNSRALHDAIQQEPHFTAACRLAGLDPLTGARIVQMQRLAGVIRISRIQETDPSPAGEVYAASQSILAELITSHVVLMSELTTPLVATDGAEAVRERMTTVLEDAGSRYPELLGGVTLGYGGNIDPDEIVRRSLKITGDRERYVRMALGELVTYLEFELRNHPRIEDAETYLDAVEGLRAKLDL